MSAEFRQHVKFRHHAARKKKNKAPGCFSDSSEAITSEYVLSPGERKLEHSARLVVNTRRMARVIIFGRAMSIYDTTTLCIRASYTKIKHANATHRAKEAKATSWVHAFVRPPTGVANFSAAFRRITANGRGRENVGRDVAFGSSKVSISLNRT